MNITPIGWLGPLTTATLAGSLSQLPALYTNKSASGEMAAGIWDRIEFSELAANRVFCASMLSNFIEITLAPEHAEEIAATIERSIR